MPTSKTKRRPKFHPFFCEGARGDKFVSLLPGRHPCQCLATKHQLVNNCTACGRIVCSQEGSGPCYFCGQVVCTKEESRIISLGTKQAVKLSNRLSQLAWAPGVKTPPYRRERCAKKKGLSGERLIEDGKSLKSDCDMDEAAHQQRLPSDDAQQRLEAGLVAALANRDRLLVYDATSVCRTRVLDDEMDYFASEGSGSAACWLSPEARERISQRVAELRAQRHSSRLQTTRLCLDLAGRCVTMADMRDEAASQLYLPDQRELEDLEDFSREVSSVGQSADHPAPDATIGDRLIDPTLNPKILQFIPQTSALKLSDNPVFTPPNLLTTYLLKPLSEFRLQDEGSRQLADEGYCLSVHQPWASFLVRGIKLHEGRTWYSAHRGCLWIASTTKRPDPDEIRIMEMNFLESGGSRANLPTSYPTGCLLGRVCVTDVLSRDEYREKYPDDPGDSPYIFVCTDPRELLLKLPISGKHKIYKLEKHVHTAAMRNLA